MPSKRLGFVRKFNRIILNPLMKQFISGKVSYYSIVYHTGRRSRKQYSTPIVAVINGQNIIAPLPYGSDTDWYLNVKVAGKCKIKNQNKFYLAENPVLVTSQKAKSAFPMDFQRKIENSKLDEFLQLDIITNK